MSIVRRFYEGALKHGLITVNPASSVKGGKDLTAPVEKMKALTGGALAVLLSRIPGDSLSGRRDRAVVGLMAIHGLRRVEVHRLNHENIHIESDDSAYLQVEGKGKKWRRVYLRPDTLAAVENYTRAKMEAGLPLDGAVFLAHGPRTRGERISRRSLNWIVDKYLDEANLKKEGVSCHALRHTFGTLAVAGGAKLEHLKETMGHVNLETTTVYVKAVERKKNNPAQFIDVEL
jgi:site-specific recombinase XerD